MDREPKREWANGRRTRRAFTPEYKAEVVKLCRESGRSPDTIGKELDLSGSLPAARDEESCSESVSDDWGRDESNEDMLNRMCEKYDGGAGPTGPDSDRQRCLEGSRNYQKMREYCIKGGIVPPKLR